jgi:hypothetical protein
MQDPLVQEFTKLQDHQFQNFIKCRIPMCRFTKLQDPHVHDFTKLQDPQLQNFIIKQDPHVQDY